MRKQRKNEVHRKGADVAHQLEDVPLSKIETASALHAAYAPSFGEPWGEPQVGLKVYYFTLGGETVNAIETCQRYVGLLERAVEEFSKAQAETDRLNRLGGLAEFPSSDNSLSHVPCGVF